MKPFAKTLRCIAAFEPNLPQRQEGKLQRIFAFDPGTAATGWAVIETDGKALSVKACGVRYHALTRQKILETAKQRLKPAQRAKALERRRWRIRKLLEVLKDCGLVHDDDLASWRTGDGSELASFAAMARSGALTREALVRVIFNVHRHRGDQSRYPDGLAARQYLESILAVQAQWHRQVGEESTRARIVEAVFYRRLADRKSNSPVSRLAKLASDQLLAVWQALKTEFGSPELTVLEDALPSVRKALVHGTDEPAADLLRQAGLAANPRLIRKAKLYMRQRDGESASARCALTGQAISFQAAMTGAVEIDHRLPRARGGSGGRHNLQLALASANRAKGAGKGHASPQVRHPVGVSDADALRQAKRLIKGRFVGTEKPSNLEFVPPRKVAFFRQALQESQSPKDRGDLRHHVADALATALAYLSDGEGQLSAEWREQAEKALGLPRLSVQTERSKRGRLHEDTRYGSPRPSSGFDAGIHVSTRKPVENLTAAMKMKIADPAIRQRACANGGHSNQSTAEIFGRARRVKVVQPAMNFIRIGSMGESFKTAVLPADNHHMDLVQMRDGTWKAFAVTRHARNQIGWRPVWEANQSGAKLVMRLHKGDMVQWQTDDGDRELLIVARLNGKSGIIHFLRPWTAASATRLVSASAGTMKKRNALPIDCGPAGIPSFRRHHAA